MAQYTVTCQGLPSEALHYFLELAIEADSPEAAAEAAWKMMDSDKPLDWELGSGSSLLCVVGYQVVAVDHLRDGKRKRMLEYPYENDDWFG